MFQGCVHVVVFDRELINLLNPLNISVTQKENYRSKSILKKWLRSESSV